MNKNIHPPTATTALANTGRPLNENRDATKKDTDVNATPPADYHIRQ